MTIASHPHPLLDTLIRELGCKTDAQLSEVLAIPAPTLSKIRRRHIGVSPFLILKIHEESGVPVSTLRDLIARAGPVNEDALLAQA